MKEAEQKYWYWVVRNYLMERADFSFPHEATLGLLNGHVNIDYITDEILYPVLRWRQLETEFEFGGGSGGLQPKTPRGRKEKSDGR